MNSLASTAVIKKISARNLQRIRVFVREMGKSSVAPRGFRLYRKHQADCELERAAPTRLIMYTNTDKSARRAHTRRKKFNYRA